MGELAMPPPNQRAATTERARAILESVREDEPFPFLRENAIDLAFDFAQEIELLICERDLQDAAWKETCSAVDARIKELEEALAAATAKDTTTNTSVGLLRVRVWSMKKDLEQIRVLIRLARLADPRDLTGFLAEIEAAAAEDKRHG